MSRISTADVVIYRRLLRQARRYWPHIGVLFLLSLLSSPLALLAPLPLKLAVDNVLGNRPLPPLLAAWLPGGGARSDTAMLTIVAGLFVAVALLSQLQGLATTWLRAYTAEHLVLDFRARLFRQTQRLSLAYHDSHGTSDSLYRIQYDAPAIQYIAIDGVIPFISAGATLLGMIYVTARLDWQLALVALAVSPALYASTRFYRRRARGRSRDVKKLESSTLSVVQEALATLRVVKAFGQEDREQQRFLRHSREGMWARIRLNVLDGGYSLVVSVLTALGTAAVLFLGIRHVRSGVLSLGNLLLVMSYLAQLYSPLKTMSKYVSSLQSSFASAERAFALLDEAPEVVERPHARPLQRARGAVAFQNVTFAYAEAERPILRDLSFTVRPGTRVGLAGATGVGKTTLVNLLTRFYDPTSGQILLDGVDLRDYRLADLRDQFAIVLQEPVLFSTSIAENIAYARPEASDEEIVAAARAAHAHDFITRLPEGYATRVGERGMRLSGGERQRISLARAFLKDAPILLLDEPTSSVDTRTEATIMAALDRLMRGRTTFLITHRPSLLELCEVRLFLEDGRLVADGAVPWVSGAARHDLVSQGSRTDG